MEERIYLISSVKKLQKIFPTHKRSSSIDINVNEGLRSTSFVHQRILKCEKVPYLQIMYLMIR
ncbi:unnamed protein product, partial [Nezara viridula]